MLLLENSLKYLAIIIIVITFCLLFVSRHKYKTMAFRDFGSCLPNRHALARYLQKKRNKKLAIFYIDLDNFKHINDAFGHMIGDQVLRSFGSRIIQLKDAKQGFFRIGGDEFVFITDYINKEYTKKVAESLLRNIKKSISIDGKTISIRGSIGISVGRLNNNFDLLLNEADIALYTAKQQGKNQIVYHGVNP
ncbi:GGDEF domain-containing protein [Gracilibacillus sp. S3-1-1]|uniref:GGDEF domain-containing protein n=1 Tax=Gracilibacillus pellucidus TaxID=3095368 RepID=A0ACC6M435_9BACI|nr:GGDEF domain-containing protein [Gracilibacillus sp. S3-1-1]MDX8045507.1 GGDEF domain-containing protein [Gracilibacillus sp. S3-1-1]